MYLDGLIHSETFRNHLPRDTKMLKHLVPPCFNCPKNAGSYWYFWARLTTSFGLHLPSTSEGYRGSHL